MNKIEQLEIDFQKALEKKDFKKMYDSIYFCCENIIKKLLIAYNKRFDFDEIVEDATLKCYNRLVNHLKEDPNYKVEKLVNFCFKTSYFTLRNPKKAFEDEVQSIQELSEAGVQIDEKNLTEEMKEEKTVLQNWTKKLQKAAIEALQCGTAKIQKPSIIDLDDVKEMTVLTVSSKGNMLVLSSVFKEE